MKKELSYLLFLPVLIIAVWIFNHYRAANSVSQSQENVGDINSAFEKVYKSSVVVKSGNLSGSGNIFEINSDSIKIVTAAHVIDDENDVTISFYDGKSESAKVTSIDTKSDYALLMISAEKMSVDDAYTSINTGNETLTAGESVFVIDAAALSASVGTIADPEIYSEDFGQNMIYCYIDSSAGMSGGGLFDSSGNYIGMVLGGSTEHEAVCLSAHSIGF